LSNSPFNILKNFFGTPVAPPKNPRNFFLSKSKVQKRKNVYIF